jgi:hypothetical protein
VRDVIVESLRDAKMGDLGVAANVTALCTRDGKPGFGRADIVLFRLACDNEIEVLVEEVKCASIDHDQPGLELAARPPTWYENEGVG